MMQREDGLRGQECWAWDVEEKENTVSGDVHTEQQARTLAANNTEEETRCEKINHV